MDQGVVRLNVLPMGQHLLRVASVAVAQPAQVAGEIRQPLALVGQCPGRLGGLAVQIGEQGAHLAAVLRLRLETVRPGQARHQHRRLVRHPAQHRAGAVRQGRGHRQAAFRQGGEQVQIGVRVSASKRSNTVSTTGRARSRPSRASISQVLFSMPWRAASAVSRRRS